MESYNECDARGYNTSHSSNDGERLNPEPAYNIRMSSNDREQLKLAYSLVLMCW